MQRLIAIGDIHGQKKKLEQLFQLIQPTSEDQLVFLGDYIDRGPDSRGVLDLLIETGRGFPDTVFLRGNHEMMLLNALTEARFKADSIFPENSDPDRFTPSDIDLFLQNGGTATLNSYRIRQVNQFPETHLEFIRRTRLYFRKDGYLFVHAGARNDLPLDQQSEYTLLWERYAQPGDKEIHVVGHSPTPDALPRFEKGRYSLDTGAGFGKPLTACEVKSKNFWQT